MKQRTVFFAFEAIIVGLIATTAVARDSVSPVAKVVELLTVLKKQIEADGQADGETYVEYAAWYRQAAHSAKRTIDESTSQISTLTEGIKEETAFQGTQTGKHDKLANALAKAEGELSESTAVREKERKTFESSESALMESVDALERSLLVMGKQGPSAASASAASLLSVATSLKKNLEEDNSLSLTSAQRDTLDGFLRAAKKLDRSMDRRDAQDGGRRQSAPNFLQVANQEQSQGGGVTETLQALLDKSQEGLQKTRVAENDARNIFAQLEMGFKRGIENKKKSIAEIRSQISASQQGQSQKEAKLEAAQELLAVTQKDLKMIEAEFQTKTTEFKDRALARSDEIMAVREASQLLTSEAAQAAISPDGAAASFLQMASDGTKQKALHTLRSATTPGLASIAIRSFTHGGPFDKVKTMIRDMLKKLEATHAQEAKKNEWCVSEMDKTTKSQHNKQEWVIKLKDRIGAMDAEIEELTDDIKTTNEELNEMQEVTSVATKVRNSENTRAGGAIQQYKDAQSMITTAMEVLKKFYSAAPDLPGGETAKEGLGAGIIGILEIAVQDFADLQEETEQSEATAAEQYKQLMQETEVKMAVFKKDLEYKSRNKVKIEGERMNAASDMKSYEKELTAIEGYLEKLKATCIAKPDSYEERKARREKELAGLKEALQYLGNGR